MSEPGSDDDAQAAEELIYARRFPRSAAPRRMELWRVITSYLQRYIPPGSAVLDLGAGNGEFIPHVVARERWATDDPRRLGFHA